MAKMTEVVLAVVQKKLTDLPQEQPPQGDMSRIMTAIEDIIKRDHELRGSTEIDSWVEDLGVVLRSLEDWVDEWDSKTLSRISFYETILWVYNYIVGEEDPTQGILLKRLSKIADDVEKMHKNMKKFKFERRPEDFYSVKPSCSNIPPVHDIEGQESKVTRLQRLLCEEETQFRTIYVSGEVGSRKSTVVYKACGRVKRHFDLFSWVPICGFYSATDVLKSIWKDCSKYNSSSNSTGTIDQENATGNKIREHLNQKRYLLVLDGIDEVATQIESVRTFLPNTGGGRVVIISRQRIPTRQDGNGISAIEIETLSEGDARDLFLAKASQHLSSSSNSSRMLLPDSLVDDIVRKCGGSPLFISLIGGLVSTRGRDSLVAWTEAVEKLNNDPRVQSDDHNKLENFLGISYSYLPPLVKACFLYTCVMFPRNMEISKTKLIRIWLAEGFVEVDPESDISAEEAAERVLKQLIQRSMLEIARLEDNGTDVKTCRVLEPMKRFATELLSTNSNFSSSFILSIDAYNNDQSRSLCTTRVSITYGRIRISHMEIKLRSLLVWKGQQYSVCINDCRRFKMIRVLILQGISSVKKVPSGVLDDLLLLRYLGLRGTEIEDLPAASLERLQKLETLDVRDTNMTRFPQCTQSLVKIRHLLLVKSCFDTAVRVPSQFLSGLTKLQTLSGLRIGAADSAQDLGSLTQLRKFSVKVRAEHSVCLCTSLNNMEFLRSLTIDCPLGVLNIGSLSNPRWPLTKLRIGGKIDQNSLQTIITIHSIVSLSLWGSNLTEDPLSTLRLLPNLVRLTLDTAYTGREIYPVDEGFSRLEHMCIFGFEELEIWRKIGTRAMRMLKTLKLKNCPNLKQPPQGLDENLGQPLQIFLKDMRPEFEDAVRRQGTYGVHII